MGFVRGLAFAALLFRRLQPFPDGGLFLRGGPAHLTLRRLQLLALAAVVDDPINHPVVVLHGHLCGAKGVLRFHRQGDDLPVQVNKLLRLLEVFHILLRQLRGEIELPHESPDDQAALAQIERTVRKEKKRAWIRGAAAVLVAVALVLGGLYGWWYANDYCYYLKYAGEHEPIGGNEGENTYHWSDGGYEFYVTVPRYPGDHGMVTVFSVPRNMPRNIVPGREVEVSLYLGREDYSFQLALTVTTRNAVPGQVHLKSETTQEFLALDAQLDPIPAGVFDQQTHDRQAQVLEDYHWEITKIIDAARAEWPFLAEK